MPRQRAYERLYPCTTPSLYPPLGLLLKLIWLNNSRSPSGRGSSAGKVENLLFPDIPSQPLTVPLLSREMCWALFLFSEEGPRKPHLVMHETKSSLQIGSGKSSPFFALRDTAWFINCSDRYLAFATLKVILWSFPLSTARLGCSTQRSTPTSGLEFLPCGPDQDPRPTVIITYFTVPIGELGAGKDIKMVQTSVKSPYE